MCFDNAAAYGKAEAISVWLARAATKKRVKNRGQITVRHSGPLIGDGEAKLPSGQLRRYFNDATNRRVANGVTHDVFDGAIEQFVAALRQARRI